MQQRGGDNEDSWRSMDSAPHDGTWVELKCTYGVAPWYCVARWTDEGLAYGRGREKHPYKADKPSWQKPEGGGPFSEGLLFWRPYTGEITSYVDPTGGLQNDAAYWRGAVASKYGLPLDHFEEQAALNAKSNAQRNSSTATAPTGLRRGFWRRLFG